MEIRRDSRRRKLLKTTCIECGKEFWVREDKLKEGKALFCNNTCKNTVLARRKHELHNQTGENNPNWKGGISKDNYHYKKIQKERYPKRVEAREIVAYNIRHGLISRQPCTVCGDVNSQAHHEDYSKPLEIIWLCKMHHDEYHKE